MSGRDLAMRHYIIYYVIYIVLSSIKENELHSTATSRIKEIFNEDELTKNEILKIQRRNK